MSVTSYEAMRGSLCSLICMIIVIASQADACAQEKPVWTFDAGSEAFSVSFSHHGEIICSGHADGTIRLWSTKTGKELNRIKAHNAAVLYVQCLDEKADYIISRGGDRKIKRWDKQVESAAIVGAGFAGIAISPCEDCFLVTDPLGGFRIRQLGIATSKVNNSFGEILLKSDGIAAEKCQYSFDGKFFVLGGDNNRIEVWETKDPKRVASLDDGPGTDGKHNSVSSLIFSKDSKQLLAGNCLGDCVIWNLQTKAVAQRWKAEGSGGVTSAFFLDGEREILASTADGFIRKWAIGKRAPVNAVRVHNDLIWQATMSRDRRWVATAGGEGKVKLWRTQDLFQP